MRIAFAGTPEFAACSLRALLEAGHDIACVLTQPDRPAGRGRKLRPSAVKQCAIDAGLQVAQPARLRDPDTIAWLHERQLDVMVVAAYGLLLPPAVLQIPRHGCVNVHASLLPRWRGAAPIQRAIAAGDTHTGVCIMQMEAGLDTGPVLARRSEPVRDDDTAGSLHDRLAAIGAAELVATLDEMAAGRARAAPQDEVGVTYAARIDKAEARIDWSASSRQIDRQVRAFNPWPMAFTTFGGERRLRVLGVTQLDHEAYPGEAAPGTLECNDWPRVATANGWLRLDAVQLAGAKAVTGDEFARGTLQTAGPTRLGCALG